MSIANDVRSYADSALEQSRQVVDQAQARFSGVQGNAQDFAGKAADKASATYADLRTKSEALYGRVSTLPVVERVTSTVEPYVAQFSAQLNGYRTTVAEKVEQAYADLKKNDQAARMLGAAEAAAGVVIETVNERVVTPVKSVLDREPATVTKAPGAKTATADSEPAKAAVKQPAKAAERAPAKATEKAPVKTTSPAEATPAKRTTQRTAKA
ncbi:MAG TPA: hypothetical protein VH373_06280 [Jatrophihabitantaceae bacterium]|jgi:hypothetical protein